jgi:hypothetical protein
MLAAGAEALLSEKCGEFNGKPSGLPPGTSAQESAQELAARKFVARGRDLA